MQQHGVVTGKNHGDLKDNRNSSTKEQRVVVKKKKVCLCLFLDVGGNCVGRRSGRVYAPISRKLLIGFTKYIHRELRMRGR